MTKVVHNIKHKYDVYIGRPSDFGNPIHLGSECLVCGKIHKSPGSTLKCYKLYFYGRLGYDKEFKEKIISLKDKTLGCWCKPKPCHGDVIAEFLDVVDNNLTNLLQKD